MNRYCIIYNTTVSYEAVVEAGNEKEAKKKVREVIGDPIQFEHVYRLHPCK